MTAFFSSEVPLKHRSWLHIPEDSVLHSHCHKNLKFPTLLIFFSRNHRPQPVFSICTTTYADATAVHLAHGSIVHVLQILNITQFVLSLQLL